MASVQWDSDMTSAVRQATDAFLQLQWRRLALTQGRQDLSAPSQWSEFTFDALRKISEDLEQIPPVWRLCTTVLRCIENGIQAPATELYLAWHSLANGNQEFYSGVEADVAEGFEYVNWSHVSRAVLDLVLLGELGRAGALAINAATVSRSMEPFTAEQESILADIFNLFVDPFTTPSAFVLWKERASQIMFDARHVLDGQDESPSDIIKQLAFDMLSLATGDAGALRRLVEELKLSAFWYVGGVAAVVDPFAPLQRLGLAFAAFCDSADWLDRVGRAALSAQSLGDLVGVAQVVSERTGHGESPHTDLAVHFLAVHLADIAAPPFVDVGARGSLVSVRNKLTVQYVQYLTERCPALWRLGALYLTYAPMADPQVLAQHLIDAAKRGSVQPVRSYMREFCDSTAPMQQTLRKALHVRVGSNPTASATLDSVLANFDHVLRKAQAAIADHEANVLIASRKLCAAVATWIDSGLYVPATAAVMNRLRGWSQVLHPTEKTVWDTELLDIGVAMRSQQIVVHSSAPAEIVQLRSSLRLCELLIDVVPCSTMDGRAAASAETLEKATRCATIGSRIAADLELPLATFFLAATAASCCSPDERQTILFELHAAVASAALRCPAHRREVGHDEGHQRVVRLLYGLAAATD